MNPNRLCARSSGARAAGESSSAAGRSSPERHARTPLSLGHVEGIEPRRRTALQATTAQALPRATLPEATDAKPPDLPRDLWSNVAGRLDARAALALSSTDKTLRAATDSIAVAKAVTASGNLPAAVHGGLRRAAALPDTDADLRLEILRSVAGRIGGSAAQSVGLVHAFLRTIEPLPPAHRADARAALEESLARLPARHQSAAFTLVKHSAALEEIDTLPDGERAIRLAALAEHVSSVQHLQLCIAMLDGLVDKVGQLPGEHRAEALAAIADALPTVVLKLYALTEEAAQPHVHNLLAMFQALPINKLGQLPLQLAQWMGSASEPSEAFDRTWNLAMSLAEAATTQQREQIATLLAGKIPNLTPAARQEAFDRTIALLGFTPLLRLVGKQDPVDTMALKYLADRLATLPETELQAAWKAMQSLANQMQLSRAHRFAEDGVIATLAAELPRLESRTQGKAVEWVQDRIWQSSKAGNDTGFRSTSCMASAKLASAIPALSEKLRQGAFETVLNGIDKVFEADDRASFEDLRGDDGRIRRRDERGAALLGQLAQAAGSLPGLAPRAAVSEILARMHKVFDDASRAEALKSLAREALPAALERPVTVGMRGSNRRKGHVTRESLLQSFTKQVEKLPPQVSVPALQHMLQEARVHTKSSSSSGDKSGKLAAMLEELMHKAARELEATVPGG